MTEESNTCPQCGGEIPEGAPQGMCPKCLLAGAAEPTEAGTIADTRPRPTPPSVEEIATAFPHLVIVELIGQGGMGFVFRARQPKLERDVALKILPRHLADDPKFAERFAREGKLLAKLNHPNIVSIFDFGESGGFFYLLMEFVDGVNLRQAMKASRFTADQALSIVPKICEALQFAHEEGVLHRDIKPENILLDAKGRIKIADFGIAKMMEHGEPDSASDVSPTSQSASASAKSDDSNVGDTSLPDPNLTVDGTSLGTPEYMAPEQIDRPTTVDHRADIYSLGVVFYELLTGELPSGQFPPPSSKTPVDAEVDAVVAQALAKERDRRQQSAAELKTQVETLHSSTSHGRRSPENNPQDLNYSDLQSWQLPASITCVAFFVLMMLGMMIAGIATSLTNSTGVYVLTLFLFVVMIPVIWVVAGKKLKDVAASGDSNAARLALSILTVIGVIGFLLFVPAAGFALFFALALLAESGGWNPNPAEAIFVPLTWLGTICLPVCSYKLVTARRLVDSSKRNSAPTTNPWPRRIFILITALVCILIVLFAVMVLLWAAAYRGNEVTPHTNLQKFSDTRNQAALTSTNTLKAPLLDGFVELIAIGNHPSDGRWWRPDGSSLAGVDFKTHGSTTGHFEGNREYEFVFKTSNLPDGPSSPTLKLPQSSGWASGDIRNPDGKSLSDLHPFSTALPENIHVTDVKIGIAVDRWEEIHRHDGTGFSSVSFSKQRDKIALSWTGTTRGVEGGIVQSVSHNLDRSANQLRMVAVLKDGSEKTSGKSDNVGDTMTAEFHDVEFEEVKGFRLEIRPYTWINFPDVKLPALKQLQSATLETDLQATTTSRELYRGTDDINIFVKKYAEAARGGNQAFLESMILRKALNPAKQEGAIALLAPRGMQKIQTITIRSVEQRMREKPESFNHLPNDVTPRHIIYVKYQREVGANYSTDSAKYFPVVERNKKLYIGAFYSEGLQADEAEPSGNATLKSPTTGDQIFLTSSNTFRAPIGSGFTELVAITHPPYKNRWWRPNGASSGPLDLNIIASRTVPKDESRIHDLVFRLADPPDGSSAMVCRIPGSKIQSTGSVLHTDGYYLADYQWFSIKMPEDVQMAEVQIGVATDEWETVHTRGGTGGLATAITWKNKKYGLSWTATTRGADRGIAQPYSHNLDAEENQFRVVAILNGGEEKTGLGGRMGDVFTTRFYDVELEDVNGFRLETRPYKWVNFSKVHLPEKTISNRNALLELQIRAILRVEPSKERDKGLSSIAHLAAESGNVQVVGRALNEMTSSVERDDAAVAAAKTLNETGKRELALSIANSIIDFAKRDRVLKELEK